MKKKLNKDKRKPTTVYMSPALIRQLDVAAERDNRNRSNMIVEFIRAGLEA